MRGLSTEPGNGAISACDKADGKTDTSVAENWFAQICAILLPHKAGIALHYLTGFEERSCQRYAAGNTPPPGYFLRTILRSEQGGIWLAALMDGCEAKWWREMQRDARNGKKYLAALDDIER